MLVVRPVDRDPVHAEPREVVVKGARGELLLDAAEEAEERHGPEAQTHGGWKAHCRGGWTGGADERHAFDGAAHRRRPSSRLAETTVGDAQTSGERLRGRTGHHSQEPGWERQHSSPPRGRGERGLELTLPDR